MHGFYGSVCVWTMCHYLFDVRRSVCMYVDEVMCSMGVSGLCVCVCG